MELRSHLMNRKQQESLPEKPPRSVSLSCFPLQMRYKELRFMENLATSLDSRLLIKVFGTADGLE